MYHNPIHKHSRHTCSYWVIAGQDFLTTTLLNVGLNKEFVAHKTNTQTNSLDAIKLYDLSSHYRATRPVCMHVSATS